MGTACFVRDIFTRWISRHGMLDGGRFLDKMGDAAVLIVGVVKLILLGEVGTTVRLFGPSSARVLSKSCNNLVHVLLVCNLVMVHASAADSANILLYGTR